MECIDYFVVTAPKLNALIIKESPVTAAAKSGDHVSMSGDKDEGEILSDEEEEMEVGVAGQQDRGTKQVIG